MIKCKILDRNYLDKEKDINNLIISVQHNNLIKYCESFVDESWIYSLADFHQVNL